MYGLTNPALDAELETEIREENPNWKDDKVMEEMNKQKKELTLFNARNTTAKSAKKPKKVKDKS